MLVQKQFQDIFTFSRASTGTRINASGAMETIAANQPRFDYEPADIPIFGPELVTNGDFGSGTTGWQVGAGATIANVSGALQITNTGTNGWATNQSNVPVSVSKTYQYIVTNKGATQITFYIRDGVGANADMLGITVNPGDTKSGTFVSNTTGINIRVFCIGAAASVASIDDVSIKEITGYSARKGDPKGLLLEEQRTNRIINSSTQPFFANGGGGSVITVTDMGGGVSQIAKTGSGGFAEAITACDMGGTIGDTFTVSNSCWVKIISGSAADVSFGTGQNMSPYAQSRDSLASLGVVADGNWHPIKNTKTMATIGDRNLRLASFAFNVATSATIQVKYAQGEIGDFATSYIPTAGSQVTRAADVCSINTLSPWWNPAEGTIIIDYQPTSLLNVGVLAVRGDSENNFHIWSVGSNTAQFERWIGAAANHVPMMTNISPQARNKIALGYSTTGSSSCANGAAAQTASGGSTPNFSSLRLFGNRWGSAANNASGYVRVLRYFPKRLTDAQLQALTA